MAIPAVMASSVPRGMARLGFFNSPDMFAPAIIPVAAGKNTAKTVQKDMPGGDAMNSYAGGAGGKAVKMETSDPINTARIRYWILKVMLVLMNTIANRTANMEKSIRRGERPG